MKKRNKQWEQHRQASAIWAQSALKGYKSVHRSGPVQEAAPLLHRALTFVPEPVP
jgi:hypothetical protein